MGLMSLKEYGLAYEPSGRDYAYSLYQPVADLNLRAQKEKQVSKSDIDQIERYADRLFASLNIDVEFTRHFMDRVKDYIRRRGENISSFEVENMVSSHPGINEAAAIAVKVDEEGRYSEDEVMIVVVKEKGENLDPKEIIEFLKPIMPKFMIPRFIKFRDSLPKTPTNRVQKAKLREEGVTDDTWDSLNS